MKNKKKKALRLKITPEARKELDALPESVRRDLMSKLIEQLQNDTLFKNSEPVDMEKLKKEDPEIYERLLKELGKTEE